MSRVKVNNITPFSGQNITLGGHAVPSGSNKNLGSETQAWSEIYVSTGSVNFVYGSPISVVVASLKAGGENGVTGPIQGMVFTETNSNLRGSFSVGRNNIASGTASLANGLNNTASANYSHAQGYAVQAKGFGSHAEGSETIASASNSHAEGNTTLALGASSHAEGVLTTASGQFSHAEGNGSLTIGQYAHAEGQYTKALGYYSHAEGDQTLAFNNAAHSEGQYSTASGEWSHAEGGYTLASGLYSHAEGLWTIALGLGSHTEGFYTIASGSYQSVAGQYNALNNSSSLFIVGAGTSVSRKDGFSVELDTTNVRPHIVVPTNTGNPNNPKAGSMYFNTGSNMMYIYNGITWRSASFA